MRKFFISRLMILMIGTMFLVKCNSGDNSKGKDQLADSTEKLSGDSLNPKAATDTTKNEMAKYVEDYKKQCERKINVDTVFLFKGDSFRLVLTHYCLHDDAEHDTVVRLPLTGFLWRLPARQTRQLICMAYVRA